MKLIAPRVHLNGTSKNELLEQLITVGASLRQTMTHLRDASPHARDYYVINSNAYTRARSEFEDRYARVKSVYAEIVAIAEAIQTNEIETEEIDNG